MPGIRIEGQAPSSASPGATPQSGMPVPQPPGGGADAFGGLSLAQLNAMQMGALTGGSPVSAFLQGHAQGNRAATSAAASYVPWNPLSRGAYPNATAENSNFNYRMSGIRANANAENSNLNYRMSGIRADANAENSNLNYRMSGIRASARAEEMNRQQVWKKNIPLDFIGAPQSRNAFAPAVNGGSEAGLWNAYRPPDVSRDTFISASAGGNVAAQAIGFLRNIDANEKTLVGIERQRWNTEQARARPSFIPPGIGHTAHPAFIPPGETYPGSLPVESGGFDIPRVPRSAISYMRPAEDGGGGGGGGGGGRGGGGRRGSGGPPSGGGGSGRLPFMGRLGLGATSKFATGALELGLAGEIIEEVALLPQHTMALEGSALSGAKPYWDFQARAAAIGRAGGFNGQSLAHSLYQGIDPPAWMKKLGLGPDEAAQMISNYGIVPTGENRSAQNSLLAEDIARMKYVPALSGLPSGTLQSSLAHAMSYGSYRENITGSPAQQFTADMVDVLAQATERGVNRASILHSIDAGVAMASRAGGGLGVTPGNTGQFMMSFAGMSNPGETGLSAMQSGIDFVGQAGKAPLASLALNSVFNRMKSVSDVRAYVESKSPGAWDAAVAKNPAITNVTAQALTQHNLIGLGLFRDVMKNFPQADYDIATNEGPGIMGAPGSALRLATRAAQSGRSAVEVQTHDDNVASGNGATINTGRVRALRAYYRGKGYTEAEISGIIGYDLEETGGTLDPRAFNPKRGGRGAMGMGQWRGARIAAFEAQYHHSPIDPSVPENQLLLEQAEFQDTELNGTERKAGSALHKQTTAAGAASVMVTLFGRSGGDAFTADRRARAFASRINENPDFSGQEDQNETRASGLAGMMGGSQVTANEAAAIIPRVNAAIQAMIDGFSRAQTLMNDPNFLVMPPP